MFFRFALEAAAALQPLYDWDIAQQALDNAAAHYNNPSSTVLQRNLITQLNATLNKPAFGHIPLVQLAVGASARATLSCATDSGDAVLHLSQCCQCLHHIGFRMHGTMGLGTAIDTAVQAVADNSDY